MAMLGSGSQFDDAIKMLWRDDTSSAEDATWPHVTDLLEDPWFRRAWIMQEVVASRSVKLVCGGCAVDWDDLFSRLRHLSHQKQLNEAVCTAFASFSRLVEMRVWESHPERWSILSLLERFRLKSSLTRDRFFSLLGIACSGNLAGFAPD
ncbi:hypothetical protein NW767_012509 [Fusarium falciforme]|nr:hypothetical protein NW767_012509 [Fusarium falciforme]